jgi:Cdc6-like AAA superfamily ATPase
MSSRTVRSEKTRTAPKSGYVRTSKGDKFVGGAAVARSNAVRKGRGNRILRPGEKQRSEQLVPRGLSPFEHFFAGLLKGEASEFLQNDTLGTWNSICKRLRLPFPQGPLKHYYNDQKQHFFYRASLIIEECRYAISQGLRGMQRRSLEEAKHTKNQNQRQQSRHQRRNAPPSNTMILSLTGVESREKTGHCTLTFVKERGGPFTLDEVQNLRQGTIFACVSENLAPTVANSVLGSILASNREAMINSKSFSVMVYKPVSKSQESIWRLTPVASLLPEQRKFEACVNNNTANIPFLLPLLGGKKPTHIKFSEQDNGNLVSVKVEHEENPNNSLFSQEEMEGSAFHLPTLNRTQEKAAATFLNSEPKTITLIQGPPGTGKTTLLVHIICQYLMESIAGDRARCLMVCAPTNKAVSVLCTRFLDTLQEVDQLPCNILLVGDDDKLLDDEQSRINRGKDTSTMRSIFLYTWIQTVLDRLSVIQNFLARPTRNQTEVQRILDLTVQLVRRLRQSLSRFPQDMGNAFDRVIKLLRDGIVVGDITQKEAMNTIGALKKEIEDWKPDLIWQDLLSSAHLIFCTLASSGSGLLKRSIGQVDDLIVDEAAASCEPEMYIPFHFMPQRLLAVGDPKQLPATVISQIAADRGLDKSLHERLMYDSDYPHIMLDVQYRMKPEISQFPSKQFYSGNVFDGPNVVR